MIEHTFSHIPGIGPKTEKRLWKQGITIHDLLEQAEMAEGYEEGQSTRQSQKMVTMLQETVRALDERDYAWIFSNFKSKEHWRFLGCGLKTAYIDIETTGLSSFNDHITSIGLYDGENYKAYIYGRNLDAFVDDIDNYDLLVTYNGKTFDVPFINSFFNVNLNKPHVDLRYPLANLGYKGGLKKIEKILGLYREGELGDVDGFMAVLLWKEYTDQGNRAALETLVAYNLEDVFNLKPLADKVYNLHLPDEFRHLELPEQWEHPEIEHQVDGDLINKLKKKMFGFRRY